MVTKTRGTCLGLTIAKKCIVAHRGTITVQSQPGEGTVCRVTLPVVYLDAADNSIGPRIRYNPPVSPPSEGVVP